MKLSIIILNWNSLHHLTQCLDSIYRHTELMDFEVIVVDNGSSDGSVPFIQAHYPDVHLIANARNRGVAVARNQGLEMSKGDYVLFLDADTVVLPNAIDTLIRVMDQQPDVGLSGPKLTDPGGTLQYSCRKVPTISSKVFRQLPARWSNWLLESEEFRNWNHATPRFVDYVIGACQVVRRVAMEDAGLYDERIFYGPEDVDYCIRMWRAGWRVLYNPNATVIHYEQRASRRWQNLIRSGLFWKHLWGLVIYFWKYRYLFRRPAIASGHCREGRRSQLLDHQPINVEASADGDRPVLSIIVPAHNAAQTLGDCLEALHHQTVPRETYEVIVVDDGSMDVTQDVAADWGIKIMSQSRQGPAAARNTGVRAAQGEIVLFIDADCVPATDWLERLVAPLGMDGVVGVAGHVQTQQVGAIPRYIQLEYDVRYDRIARSKCVDFLSSATAAYWRSVFEAVEGFDAALYAAEDTELSFRLAEAGYKLAFEPAAIVYHRHPQTAIDYLRRKFHYGYWRAKVYHRFPRKIALDSRTPQWQKLQTVLAPLIVISALGSLVWRPWWRVSGLLVALFSLVSLPFLRRAWRTDKWVAFLSLPLLFTSAGATALGLAIGFLEHGLGRKQSR